MRKNWIIVLLVFMVPLGLYMWLTSSKADIQPSIAATAGDEIIKFASPMCYECQELEKIFDEVFPKYQDKITLRKIDVTSKDKNVRALIKEYDVKLVPTTVFKNQDGKITRRIEGCIQPVILDNYLKELING